jgi:4-diphosphocytidyl-2-C-methyl-D-erythritol kinase
MIIFPTCKINLGLHVLEKRSDGFHNLETVMVEIPWTDEIEFEESTEDSFEIQGLKITGHDNLILRALRLAGEHAPIPPLKICLKKNIPMGAGLGGGSSDAAKFYAELARIYFPERAVSDLENDISSIGSDCAFFIKGGTQLCTGRGEILNPTPLDLKGKHVVIVNPGIHISTAEAFSKIIPNADRESIQDIIKLDIKEWNGRLKNDFEESLFPLYPELQEIKSKLLDYGAVYAAMTGSGSTMFGIFSDLSDAAATKIDQAKFMKLVSF